jgi:Cu/Ag efflux protein CusF
MKVRALLLGSCMAVMAISSVTEAQVRTKSTDGEPCCSITAVDVAKGIATARDKTGKSFRFSVKDAALLKSLRAGQAVFADFKTGKVRVHGAEPCCAIVTAPTGNPGVDPLEPCCGITAFDAATGIVTAKELATGRVFRFEVKDATLLRSLKVGQKVFADFGTSKVRVHGSEPCCNIIGHGVN